MYSSKILYMRRALLRNVSINAHTEHIQHCRYHRHIDSGLRHNEHCTIKRTSKPSIPSFVLDVQDIMTFDNEHYCCSRFISRDREARASFWAFGGVTGQTTRPEPLKFPQFRGRTSLLIDEDSMAVCSVTKRLGASMRLILYFHETTEQLKKTSSPSDWYNLMFSAWLAKVRSATYSARFNMPAGMVITEDDLHDFWSTTFPGWTPYKFCAAIWEKCAEKVWIPLQRLWQRLNHKLPFSTWSLDYAFKDAGKLRAHYGYLSIEARFDDTGAPHYAVKCTPADLTVEEKEAEEWHLASTDARKTRSLSASTCVVNTEMGLPLRTLLMPGGIRGKKQTECHENMIPVIAASMLEAFRYCVDFDKYLVRVVKTDGADRNTNIVEYALNYLIENHGRYIWNEPEQKYIDLAYIQIMFGHCHWHRCINKKKSNIWSYKDDPEKKVAMFDHIIDARRCERAVDEYYVTYNVKQVTAKQFVERHSTLFSNTESMGSLRFYMKHVMLLKLASNANSRRIKQHPMWQELSDWGFQKVYDDLLTSILQQVTAPTLRYIFGFLLSDSAVWSDFVDEERTDEETHHMIKTKWFSNGRESVRTEMYMNECIAPTSVVLWFRGRLHQAAWINVKYLTGFGYQNKAQYRAYVDSWWTFYAQERYLPLSQRAVLGANNERIDGVPLIDLNRLSARRRFAKELGNTEITNSWNSTYAPSPIVIGSMSTEAINAFHESYNAKCRSKRVETWIQRSALKFCSLSLRQWDTHHGRWIASYPELVEEYRELKRRFLMLTDLLCQDRFCPTLRIDSKAKKQYMMQYVHTQQIPIHKESTHFGHSHYLRLAMWWNERLQEDGDWILTRAALKKLCVHFWNQFKPEELGRYCAAIGMDLY